MAVRASFLIVAAAALAGCAAHPEPTAAKRFVSSVDAPRATVWAVGDGADGGAASRRLGDFLAERHPARFLYLGDVYETGTAEEFRTNYDPAFGPLARVTAPTAGNHEWRNRAIGYRPYWRAKKGVDPPDWYSFRVAGWQVLSLSSEAPHDAGSRQLAWLGRRVSRGGTCRIAFLHRPRWSAGRHGNQRDLAPVWQALAHRARLLLGGHDHDMQQFRSRRGIVQLVAGSGGRERYAVDKEHRGLVWSNARALGALRIKLEPRLARFAFVRADGRVLRRDSVRCRPPAR